MRMRHAYCRCIERCIYSDVHEETSHSSDRYLLLPNAIPSSQRQKKSQSSCILIEVSFQPRYLSFPLILFLLDNPLNRKLIFLSVLGVYGGGDGGGSRTALFHDILIPYWSITGTLRRSGRSLSLFPRVRFRKLFSFFVVIDADLQALPRRYDARCI